jgi:putative transposase
MNQESPNHLAKRSRPVHQPVIGDGNAAVIVFLTVCTANRQPLLATTAMHDLLRESWGKGGRVAGGRYVIMPEHIHLFCAPGTTPPESLRSWISYWKRLVAFRSGGSFWQRNFWDTQLRRHEKYGAKWDYVRNNPVRSGLVRTPNDWPFQGELNMLRWHD